MTTQRFITIAAGAAVAGGVAWLIKLAVLAATDGAESLAVATLYGSGLLLLAVGSIGIALRLLERRPLWLRIASGVLAPVVFFAAFLFLDSLLVPLTEEHVADWAKAEAGVLATALIWLAAGAWALRSSRNSAVRSTLPTR
ncbi:MAG: hypothetical protein H0V45_06670 [Actinobacteria bacterium]|nr:hypothetical protein [Actinomycetota bacterium]